MGNYKVISSDSHVVEPPDIWVDRMDKNKFGDRIPHMVKGDPHDFWSVDNKATGQMGAITQAGRRFDRPQDIIQEGAFADVRPGGYIPSEHVKDMETDGIYGGLVYPSVGLALYRDMEDTELTQAVFSAYNDWLADFCNAYPDRLKGAAMIVIDDKVEDAINEIRRASENGLNSAMISSHPRADLTYDQPMYEPLWAASEEMGITLNLHVTTNRPGAQPVPPGASLSSDQLGFRGASLASRTASGIQNEYWVRMSLCHIIFSGVLERYPKLKFANVEHELGWIPFFINRMDRAYQEKQQGIPVWFKIDALPSDFMRNNVYHSFQEDGLGIQLRHIIGVENLMWGSDYPHAESTFPKSLEILDKILEGVPEDEKALIVGENAAKLYDFN